MTTPQLCTDQIYTTLRQALQRETHGPVTTAEDTLLRATARKLVAVAGAAAQLELPFDGGAA
jgi:hypothetical protein